MAARRRSSWSRLIERSDFTSGSPAPTMVESWRAKSATEAGFTAPFRRRPRSRQTALRSTPGAASPSAARVSIETGTSCAPSSMRSTSSSEVATSTPS